MRSSLAPSEKANTVKLTVEIDPVELDRAIDTACRRVSREVRIPGFRPGHAPRRVLEARLGQETLRQEALRDVIPELYAKAVDEHGIDAIAPPEIELGHPEGDGEPALPAMGEPVSFEAVVQVRPELNLVGYQGLEVTAPTLDVGEEEIDAHVDRLRDHYAELRAVERPAADGDHVTIDIRATLDGEAVPGLTAERFVYELGSGTVVPELDEALRDKVVGAEVAFPATLPSGGGADESSPVVEFQVVVREIREKVLPDPNDAWASDATEFDTIEELRADIRQRLQRAREAEAAMALRGRVLEALVALVDEEVPEVLVAQELQQRIEGFANQLAANGISLERYLALTGQSEGDIVAGMRADAETSVKVDLALRAVARGEGLEASDEDIEREIDAIAKQQQIDVAKVRARLEEQGSMRAVSSEVVKTKALGWLLEHVSLVDADGKPVDRSRYGLAGPEGAETGADERERQEEPMTVEDPAQVAPGGEGNEA